MGKRLSTFACAVCGKDTFKSAGALAAHQAAVGHLKLSESTNNLRPPTTSTLVTSTKSLDAVHEFKRQTYIDVRLDLQIHGRDFVALSQENQILVYERLLSRCHSTARLKAEGYRLTILSPEDKPRREKSRKGDSDQDTSNINTASPSGDQLLSKKIADETTGNLSAHTRTSESRGEKREKPRDTTPYTQAPKAVRQLRHNKRKALALDCEMVMVEGGHSELAFLSVVDFLTGEVLIHKYVKPTLRVLNWLTRHSGITPIAMNAATAAGQALEGWPAAQQALWRYADTDTILIGHSLYNDLKALKIIHFRIVDSAILSAEPVFNPEPEVRLTRIWALKKIAETFLDRAIQCGGKRGHDCLEDTYATRDVVIWCLLNPDQLTAWARNAKVEHDLRVEEDKKARERERQEKRQQKEREEVALLMGIELE